MLILTFLPLYPARAETTDDPCRGPSEILSITEGGGYLTSPCVVPFKQLYLEGEHEYQLLKPYGTLQNYPQTFIRLGLPAKSEVGFLLPSYNRLTDPLLSGYTSLNVNVKKQIFQNKQWLFTVNGILIFPGGSSAFGSKEFGVSIDSIANYSIAEQWAAYFMLEVSSFTVPPLAGGGRLIQYTPDFLLSYTPKENISLFAEVFALSKTAPGQSGAGIADVGFLYMLKPHVALDFTYFYQFSNNLTIYEHDFMAGLTFALD
jgi:hypothetical protein